MEKRTIELKHRGYCMTLQADITTKQFEDAVFWFKESIDKIYKEFNEKIDQACSQSVKNMINAYIGDVNGQDRSDQPTV
jgi:hypothetical protein